MRILAATNNQNKLREIRRVLEPLGVNVIAPADLGLQVEVAETGTTFAENAQLKAEAFFRASGLPSLADDSGLCVDALEGRPGVYSSSYQGENATAERKISALLDELAGVPETRRTARFVSAVCCVLDEETILRCEGVCEGVIGVRPAGEGGFGYDPVFYVQGKSFAQLTGEEKDKLSHRGKALRAFATKLEDSI